MMRRAAGQSRLSAVLLLLALAAIWPSASAVARSSASGGDDGDAGETPTTSTTPPPQGFTGTLLDAGEPVEGAEVFVETLDGDEIGREESDQDGNWTVGVDEPGRYQVTLDVDSLPDDVELAESARSTLELDVFPGNLTRALFPLGETTVAKGPNLWEKLAQNSVNGLKFGLIIAMASIGLSLIFGTTGLINFAHGEIVTLGAVIAWFLNARGPEWPLILAGLVAALVTGLFGGGLEMGVWRPLRKRQVGLFQLFVITIGLSLIIRHVILIWFGSRRRQYVDYNIQKEWEIGPISITPRDFAVIVISVVVLVLIATMLQRTRTGKALRAVSDSVELSEASGIDVQRVILIVWISGAALAAIGGVLLGAVETVDWQMGTRLLLLMFSAVILGGLGTAYGAMVGGIAVGLVVEVSTIWVSPVLKVVFALAALVLALLVRPQGILGRRERIG